MNYTEAMFTNCSPYNNSYQGLDKRILFVCSAGLLRSATAARIYSHKYNTRSAGSAVYALIPVTKELLLWAQQVVFVNKVNKENVEVNFDLSSFPLEVITLDIPDKFEYMNPKLIDCFEQQYETR